MPPAICIPAGGVHKQFCVADKPKDTTMWSKDRTAKQDDEWKPGTSFTSDQLLQVGRDLFLAATDTTSTSVGWILLYLCKHKCVQEKVQKELDVVLDKDGVLATNLVNNFPYFRAVLQVSINVQKRRLTYMMS